MKSLIALIAAACLNFMPAEANEKPVEAVYFDFAMSFGTNIWPYIDWSATPATIDLDKMDSYLESLFSQMKGAGQTTVYLSFAQLDNIDVYASGNFLAPETDTISDVIAQLLSQFQKYTIVTPGYDNFLYYVVQSAHRNGMELAVAFGGLNARATTFKVLNQAGETYNGQAEKLSIIAANYAIDRFDFDIEDSTALSSQPLDGEGDSIIVFFETLHSKLNAAKRTMTLTSMLSLADWPNGALKPLFYNSAGQPIFSTIFDGLNMMAYSDTQYWIDPSNISWGIEQWLDIIGKENAGLMHIGFDDGVLYALPGANAGSYVYHIKEGSTDGQAAAQILSELEAQLAADGYDAALGTPFFWPAADLQPNGKSRYSMTDQQSNFVSQEMQDFFDYTVTNRGRRPE